MLPFLKHSQEASVSAPIEPVKRKPDEESEDYDPMESAMEELCDAIQKKEYKAAASAFRSAFDLLEMAPHAEGPHTNK